MKRTYSFNIPEGQSADKVKTWVVESMRPCHPMVLTELSQLITRKRPFESDSQMAEIILQQTFEQLSKYPEAVFYWTVQDAWESPSNQFPQYHEIEKWAKENLTTIQFLDTYFMHGEK